MRMREVSRGYLPPRLDVASDNRIEYAMKYVINRVVPLRLIEMLRGVLSV